MVLLQDVVKADECVLEPFSEVKALAVLIVYDALDLFVYLPSPTQHNLPLVKNVCWFSFQYVPVLHE